LRYNKTASAHKNFCSLGATDIFKQMRKSYF
jgi:hypothetical protein